MNILLTGATGFIGSAINLALQAQGHTVVRAVRTPSYPSDIAVNFVTDTVVSDWLPRLQGIDAVVNAVGLLGGSTALMQAVHEHTPTALAQAAAQLGIQRFIQISALGVDSGLDTLYYRSKWAGEQGIRKAFAQAHVVRPSLVFGRGGDSTEMFIQLTRMPLLMLPKAGQVTVQPVHVQDVAAAVVALLNIEHAQTVAAVGPSAMSLAAYLKSLTQQLGRRAPFKLHTILPMPLALARLSAQCAGKLPQHVWTPDTLAMLLAGSQADAAPFAQLLGRLPRAVDTFVAS